MKFSGNVHLGLGNIRLNFGGDPGHGPVAMATKRCVFRSRFHYFQLNQLVLKKLLTDFHEIFKKCPPWAREYSSKF